MNRNDRQFIVQKIRSQYLERQPSELDELRALDARVRRPANIFAYSFGSLGAIVMGAGMSLVMTDLAETLGLSSPMVSGVVIGVVGMAMAIANYPIYRGILASRRKKYAAQVLKLTEEV